MGHIHSRLFERRLIVLITTLGRLLLDTLSVYRNFGRKSLDEIKEKIEKHGLELGMPISDRLLSALEAEAAKIRANAEEENN